MRGSLAHPEPAIELDNQFRGLVGEDLRTQLHVDEMAALLASHDFTVLSDEADIDLASRYWNDPPAARPLSMRVFPEWERLVLAGRAKG